jgi:predicted ATPase
VLADVSAHQGHPEEGLQALAEAHTLVEQHEERWWEAEVCRLRGVLFLNAACRVRQVAKPMRPCVGAAQLPTADAVTESEELTAEACFQRALDVARRQEAKSLELRAAVSLARLWQQQGKRQKAYNLLAPVYGWFTEGFDTADLQEAKALLNGLA